MPPYDISSPANEKIKRLVRLRDRKHRDAEGVFVVEGNRNLGRALAAGLTPIEVYADPESESLSDLEWSSVTTVHRQALARASYRQQSEGIIAVFEQFATDLGRIEVGDPPLILVVEGIEKPGNLGAMLRTADAVGADALVATGTAVDPFNPNVVRASTGALFTIPLVCSLFEEFEAWRTSGDIGLIAASPESSIPVWDVDLTRSTAIMVGAEHIGLSREAKSAADSLVSVPMAGGVDSLNASASLAVLAFEAVRQRSTD